VRSGLVFPAVFWRWDFGKGRPEGFCLSVGPETQSVTQDEMREYLANSLGRATGAELRERLNQLGHDICTSVSWRETYAQCAYQLWTRILSPMLRLGREYGLENVRLVMNFDS
jgi:hypothetical protein